MQFFRVRAAFCCIRHRCPDVTAWAIWASGRTVFESLEVWFVGVQCPLNVLEQRERERQDRTLGQERAQFNVVHQHCIYDLEVDTSLSTTELCAVQIKERLESGSPPYAFEQMKRASLDE